MWHLRYLYVPRVCPLGVLYSCPLCVCVADTPLPSSLHFLLYRQHYEHKLREMDVEVHRHEQEHERLLSDLAKLEKQTEVAVQVR